MSGHENYDRFMGFEWIIMVSKKILLFSFKEKELISEKYKIFAIFLPFFDVRK